MSYIGQGLPADTFQGYTTDSFTGNGSATTFTLSKQPFSENSLIVVINNVIQKPTTNFTVSGTTLTIVGTAVASGDVIYAIHTGGVLPIGEANRADLNGASDQLILDQDGDSTISADTDDQIDFKIGGADAMSLGSDLTANVSGEINLDADGGKVRLKDGGTEVARFVLDNGSGDLEIVSSISDKDIKLKGIDGGSSVTAVTVDMSEGGLVGIGTSSPNAGIHVDAPTTAVWAGRIIQNTSSYHGFIVVTEGTGGEYGLAVYNNSAFKFTVSQNGNVANVNNSYGQISDQKKKENIVDATAKLEDVKKIKVRNFNFIGDDLKQIGVVAQELETVFPSLVEEIEEQNDKGEKTGEKVKAVKYSVLTPILLKALQEADDKIDALTARVKALEDA